MTSKSIPWEECLALAHRVSGGDRAYVDWLRLDQGDKTCDKYFDNIHALATGLAREVEAAGHVVRTSSGSYVLANPNDGRFQPLKKKLESEWLPHAQELSLVEYFESLFVKERGAIRREEIERIGLALVDRRVGSRNVTAAQQTANEKMAAATLGKRRKGKRGRKKKYTSAQLEALKRETFRLLDEYGDPEHNNPHPEFKSKEDLIRALQLFTNQKPKDFDREAPRSTIQADVDRWLDEWRTQRIACVAGN
jgi:hypothetical protein